MQLPAQLRGLRAKPWRPWANRPGATGIRGLNRWRPVRWPCPRRFGRSLDRQSIPQTDFGGVEVVLIRGNHDSLSNASRTVKWSNGVIQLGAEKATSHLIDRCGLAIHGQSFGARAVYENIAATYPEAQSGYFNVGMLHTSLVGATAHEPYAPTTVDVLEGRGYDYWALGHIHLRTTTSLSDRCWVGFSGNTQGRHVRESGPKAVTWSTSKTAPSNKWNSWPPIACAGSNWKWMSAASINWAI